MKHASHDCPHCRKPLSSAIEREPTASDRRRYGRAPVHALGGAFLNNELLAVVVGECPLHGLVTKPLRGVPQPV